MTNKLKLKSTIYYHLKPLIPRRIQIWLRRRVIHRKRVRYSNVWPILKKSGKPPKGWPGWPDQKQFAILLTHDVEMAGGQEKCRRLMDIEKGLGFRSSFYFVPERYEVSSKLRYYITKQGFEVGIHGLSHDGKLYQSEKIFRERSKKINEYLKFWNAVGFRSPSAHHNLEWIKNLNIEYDSSTFDTDPFEPQPDGAGTIFPFWVQGNSGQKGYVELPYTLSQDFSLFILMKEVNIDIWIKKLDWIAEKGGMAIIDVHPDYINFDGKESGFQEYPVDYYLDILNYIKTKYDNRFWHALPKDVAFFCKKIWSESEG